MVKKTTIACIAILISSLCVQNSEAYTPEDPIVKGMVKKAASFLESYKRTKDDRGEDILLAYAHYKSDYDSNHAMVQRGIAAAVELARDPHAGNTHKINYDAPVAVLLLSSIDAVKYKPQLIAIQRYLFETQHTDGGWTYHDYKTGDISQTQYVLLAIWILDRLGIPLDYQKVGKAAAWLLRVQDPSGGWPYQGEDPGIGKPLIAQKSRVTYSMGLAGGSSLLIAGDALRLWGDTQFANDPNIPGLPEAIKLYKEDNNSRRRKRGKLSKEPILRACSAMENFRRDKMFKRIKSPDFFYYELYSLERYESFIEIAYGKAKDKSPAWYNRGVDELRKLQGADGGFKDAKSYTAPHINASFAILFLLRSTQKSISSVVDGSARGGFGFDDDVTNAKLGANGSVETKPIATEVNQMLDILDDDDPDKLNGKALPDNLALSKDPKDRAAQLDRLERLVRGSKSWQARRVAARLLGKSDEMRVVPALIYALTDGDKMVKRLARDGLRFISRKFDGYGMPDDPTGSQTFNGQRKWRQWYLTMFPDHVFLE